MYIKGVIVQLELYLEILIVHLPLKEMGGRENLSDLNAPALWDNLRKYIGQTYDQNFHQIWYSTTAWAKDTQLSLSFLRLQQMKRAFFPFGLCGGVKSWR